MYFELIDFKKIDNLTFWYIGIYHYNTQHIHTMQSQFLSLDTVRETVRELKLNVLQNICDGPSVKATLVVLKNQYIKMSNTNYFNSNKIIVQPFGYLHDLPEPHQDTSIRIRSEVVNSLKIDSSLSSPFTPNIGTDSNMCINSDDFANTEINRPFELRPVNQILNGKMSVLKKVFEMIDKLILLLSNESVNISNMEIIMNLENIDKACNEHNYGEDTFF